jgi:hypothetical protein
MLMHRRRTYLQASSQLRAVGRRSELLFEGLLGTVGLYDNCTIDTALWHFRAILHFLESATYRKQRTVSGSTPAASTKSFIINNLYRVTRAGFPPASAFSQIFRHKEDAVEPRSGFAPRSRHVIDGKPLSATVQFGF